MDALAAEAERFVEAFAQGDAAGVVQAADAHGEAMRRLGEAAGVGIVEENLARVAQMARAAGGAAKPSGAGGGDVAVAFFADAAEAAQFERACHEAGMDLLNLRLGAEGLLPLEQQG
jgi:phosphomevalonate kinase